MRAAWPILLLLAACGGGDPGPEPTLEERLAAQPGFWFEAPSSGAREQRLRELAALGYADGYEPATDEVGVLVQREGRAPGVDLYCSGHGPEALLIDAMGEVLHRWSYPFERLTGVPAMEHSSQDAWRRVRLLDDGSLLAIHEGLCLLKVDRGSELEWVFGGFAHHDLDLAPDGRIYTLTRREQRLPELNESEDLLVDSVAVLSPEGELLREVSVVECLARSRWSDRLRAAAKVGGDCLHTNSIELLDGSLAGEDPVLTAGRVLVCLRELHAVGVIDLEQRRFVWWREGAYRAPHDPHLLPARRMLIFDNMGHAGYSRALEVGTLSGEERWSFGGEPPQAFFSVFCGAATRLAGGNTLVTESTAGRAYEVSPEGEVVWAFASPHRAGPDGELVAALFEVSRVPRPIWLDR